MGEKTEGLSKNKQAKNKKINANTEHSMVITREGPGVGKVEEGKAEINWDERRLDLG